MKDYIILMHNDSSNSAIANDEKGWGNYFKLLQKSGLFEGGSEIGKGVAIRKSGKVGSSSDHLSGFIRIRANHLEHAKEFLVGNPIYEGGGTVEIRELPQN